MGKLNAVSWLRMRGWGWGRKKGGAEGKKAAIGVLAFEVANFMSKAVHLWRALEGERVAGLRDEAMRLEGVRRLVSDDEEFLLGLAFAETMDSVHLIAQFVARLGTWCAAPVLQRFEHVFSDLLENAYDLYGLEYSEKKMEREVKKMERLVTASSNLYQELVALSEMEQELRRMQGIPEMRRHGFSFAGFKQRVLWQRRAVKRLQDASVWNRSYDYTALLLASCLFTIVGRIKLVFGFRDKDLAFKPKTTGHLSRNIFSFSGQIQPSVGRSGVRRNDLFSSGPIAGPKSLVKHWNSRIHWLDFRRPLMKSMVGGKSVPLLDDLHMPSSVARKGNEEGEEVDDLEPHVNLLNMNLPLSLFSRRKFLNAPPSTLGASALALHYANLIIVIEKFAESPYLIVPSVRDDLYNMLSRSIKVALKMRLKAYAKNLSSSVYDLALAAEWSEAMTRMLEWLAPLAHNTVKWQSARKFEQPHFVSSTNILLLQTLYYANQAKVEAAITELLVGLNYLWRFGRELDAKSMLECVVNRSLSDSWEKESMSQLVGK